MKEGFFFYENFKATADTLSDDMRLKFYDALTEYAINGIEPDDEFMKALITAFKPSLDKVETRGGAREGAGRPKKSINQEIEEEYQNNQKNQNNSNEIKNNQNIQSFNKQETRNKKQENITISNDMVVKKPVFDVNLINQTLQKFNLATIRGLTDERKTKLRQRCESVGGFENFLGQLEVALAESSFLRGENKQGWKADFDFFLQKASWQKVVEGSYKDRKPEIGAWDNNTYSVGDY